MQRDRSASAIFNNILAECVVRCTPASSILNSIEKVKRHGVWRRAPSAADRYTVDRAHNPHHVPSRNALRNHNVKQTAALRASIELLLGRTDPGSGRLSGGGARPAHVGRRDGAELHRNAPHVPGEPCVTQKTCHHLRPDSSLDTSLISDCKNTPRKVA